LWLTLFFYNNNRYLEMSARQTIVCEHFDGIHDVDDVVEDDDDDDDSCRLDSMDIDDPHIDNGRGGNRGSNNERKKKVTIGGALPPILLKDSSNIQMLLGKLLDVDTMTVINQECTRYVGEREGLWTSLRTSLRPPENENESGVESVIAALRSPRGADDGSEKRSDECHAMPRRFAPRRFAPLALFASLLVVRSAHRYRSCS